MIRAILSGLIASMSVSLAAATPITAVDLAVNTLVRLEGFSATPYRDHTQVSIGYGTKARAGEMTITRADARLRLRAACVILDHRISRLVKVKLTVSQRATLISFAYNLGIGALQKSALLKRLNRGEYAAVPEELRRFVYASGKVNRGLMNRRNHEVRLWLS